MKMCPLVLLLVGCFDAGAPPLTCSAEQSACPEGLQCNNSRCEPITDGDLATLADMTAADMLADAAISACTSSNGAPLGSKGAWVCPGLFGGANPKAAALCRSGKLCADSSLITAQECAAVSGGFYTSSYWGSTLLADPKAVGCNTAASYDLAFFGCGVGWVTTTGCAGFSISLQVNPGNKLEISAPYKIENLINTNPQNGVICCP